MNEEAKKIIDKKTEEDIKKNGKHSAYIEKTNYLLEKYKAALFFVFFQIIIIILLLFGFLTMKSSTVVEVMLPKIIKDTDYGKLKIGVDGSNELYYKIFGTYLTELMLNSNAKNVSHNTKVLLKIMHPRYVKKYKKNIENFQQFVELNSASLKYKTISDSVTINDAGEAIYRNEGKLFLKIGNKEKEQMCTTKVKMKTENYMLFVMSFLQNCKDIEDK